MLPLRSGLPKALVSLLTLATLTSGVAAAPTDLVWKGTTDGNWNESTNWLPQLTPNSDDRVTIPAGTPNVPQILFNNVSVEAVTVQSGALLAVIGPHDLTVLDDLLVQGTLDLQSSDCLLTVVGNYVQAAGSTVNSADEVDLNGDGTLSISSTASEPVMRVIGGTRTALGSTVDILVLDSGTLHLAEATTLTVTGNLQLNGGTLSFEPLGGNFETLRVTGNLNESAVTIGTTSTLSRIEVAGDLNTQGGLFMDEGWLRLNGGDATITGVNASYKRVTLLSGLKTLVGDMGISGALVSTGGTTTGPGRFGLTNTLQPLSTGTNRIHAVRVLGGTVEVSSSRIADFELQNGELIIRDATILTIEDEARFFGGTLSFAAAGNNFDVIDVAGDINAFGCSFGVTTTLSRIRCAGNYQGDSMFAMPTGRMEFDGVGVTTIGGVQPTFGDLVVKNGTRQALGALDCNGSVTVEGTGTLALGAFSMDVAGDFTANASGAQVMGAGPLFFTGNGYFLTASNLMPPVSLVSGEREARQARTVSLTVTGGVLEMADASNLMIDGNAVLAGGSIEFDSALGNFDTLRVGGNLLQTTTSIATDSNQSRIFVDGDWTSESGFVLPNGTVFLQGGDATIGGPSPRFRLLTVNAGNYTLATDVEIVGTLDLNSGSLMGPSWLELLGTSAPVSTGANLVQRLRIAGGANTIVTSRVNELELLNGSLELLDAATLTVQTEARLIGGELAFAPAGGNFDTLRVNGDLTHSGTTVGTTSSQSRVRVAGDWSSETDFVLDEGWVLLDGGAATIGGFDPRFKRLELDSGLKTVLSEVEIIGTVISTGGETDGPEWLEITNSVQAVSTGANRIARLRIENGTVPFTSSRIGELELTGGELLIQDAVTLTVEGEARLSGGELSFAPAGGNFDTLDVNGDLVVTGTVPGTDSSLARIRTAGDWVGDVGFEMLTGWIELDGATDTEIRGSAPVVGNLRLLGAPRRLASDVLVSGGLEIGSGATLDVADRDLEVVGDLVALGGASGGVGDGPIRLTGDGLLQTSGQSLPPIRVEQGLRDARNCTVESIELVGGTLNINEAGTLKVTGEARFTGGELAFEPAGGNFDTLDVNGDLVQSGSTLGTTSTQSRIFVAGDWSSDTPFSMGSGWVFMDGGDAEIGGAAPGFRRLQLSSGVRTVTAETRVDGELKLTGGETAGTEPIVAIGATGNWSTGARRIANLRLSAGVIPFQTSRAGTLEIAGGEMLLNDATTFTVEDEARLAGGVLSFASAGGNFDRLVVLGDLLQTGTLSGQSSSLSRLQVAGDWSSNSSFQMGAGRVELTGTGTLSGSLPGFDPTFPELQVTGGVRSASGDLTLSATSLTVLGGARLESVSADLGIEGTPVSVSGTLAAGPDGELALFPNSSLTVSGTLELIGLPGQPAVLEGIGGGLDCTVTGTLAARDFEVRGPGPQGFVMATGSNFAGAPNNMNGGLFTNPAPDPGSVLLDLRQSAGQTFQFMRFEDPAGQGTFNVRRTTGSSVAFQNFLGAFSGPTLEDDLGDRIDWLPPAATELESFSAGNGPEQAELFFETSQEIDVDRFLLERAFSISGPFATLVELPPVGPSVYGFIDAPLFADIEVFYRVSERLNSGFVRVLGTDSAMPYSADLPANILTVGASGAFSDIQSAVDAATAATTILRVEAGTYPSFVIDGLGIARLHIVPDGSGPVLIDASAAPVEIANIGILQAVELVDLVVTGGTSGPAVLVRSSSGAVLLDGLTVTGGAGEPGLDVRGSTALVASNSSLTGVPGALFQFGSRGYAGRGTIDTLELASGSTVQTCGVIPGATIAPGGTTLIEHPGVMPDLEFESFQSLGDAIPMQLEAEPGIFFQLYASQSTLPVDLNDPAFWQMLLVVDATANTLVTQGATNASTGLAAFSPELPALGVFLGARFTLQAATIQVVPQPQVRFSNPSTVIGLP